MTLARPRLGDRALFPALDAASYCNHAAISPPSLAVKAAVNAWLEDYGAHGTSAFMRWLDQRERLREKLAALIGADADEIGLVQNTSQGGTFVALSVPWRRGDRVVLFEGEFPANVTPWQQAAERFGVEIAWVPLGAFARGNEEGLAALRRALSPGARLVAVSAVQFQTGLAMPLAAIAGLAHEAGAALFVDAIQALGCVPVDVGATGVDYLSCGGHKWLMGVEGQGFVYVRRERLLELLPTVAGWLGHVDGWKFLFDGAGHLRYDRPFRRDARFVESGALNGMGCAALEASVDLLVELSVPAIFSHVQAFHDALEPPMIERGFRSLRSRRADRRSGILSFEVPSGRDLAEVHRGLLALGVSCATPDGLLRFAPHWPNDPGREVPVILSALDASL